MLPVILLFGSARRDHPHQSTAAAAFYALFASTVLYRAVTWRQLYDAMLTSGKATTSIGMLIAGALIFNYVVTIENIPASIARLLAGQDFSATMPFLVVNPGGIAHDGIRFNRTAVTASLFRDLELDQGAKSKVASPISTSWNQLAYWLRAVDGLRRAA